MTEDFHDGKWFLAGSIVRGIGRTWLVTAHGLSHVEPGEPLHMSAPTLGDARRWLRTKLGVPLRYDAFSDRGFFAYCLDKYVEQISKLEHDGETESYV